LVSLHSDDFHDFDYFELYKLIEITKEVILGTLLRGTSQCNSSLESRGATLQDGMARSDFQWPGKPQGEIRSFSEVKGLIN
jgi:hypothetical protein